jgi:PAS domain S-box-containing protein
MDVAPMTHTTDQDVAERRRLEDALRATEEKLRLLANAMPQLVCVLLPDGSAEYVNPSWIAFSGLDLAATNRAGWEQVLHPDDVPAARECRRLALKLLAPQDVELRYRAADGTFRWFLSRLAPVVEDGRVARMVGSAIDIEDRRRAEAALQEANQRLREADRRKDDFLGILSHELRSPLAPIRNSVYVLRHAGGAQAERALHVIERQTAHLTRLVDDLLDVTRIARGKMQLRSERIDLRDVARRTGEDFRSLMEDRGVAFGVLLPEERVWVHADATRLAQVTANLLHNAAKFTRPGDAVTLSLDVVGDAACIRVRDTGAGIDPALLPTVFDAFVQVDRTLARAEGGLGLGLALVRGIVELHGGSVAAESAGKGRGTEFTVRLPLAPPAEDGRQADLGRGDRGATGRRVLVVDDDRDAADSLAQLVALLGHDSEVAYDAQTALAKARARLPDVVLCDIGLPGMDGYEVARALRASSPGRLRLVAVSGYAQPEDVTRAIEAGFDAHVAKPPDPERLEDLLRP